MSADFAWSRERLFDQALARSIFRLVEAAGVATVVSEGGVENRRNPPFPLNTLEMQKRINRTIRVSPEQIMKIAEAETETSTRITQFSALTRPVRIISHYPIADRINLAYDPVKP